jgi:hypothetical protein
MTHINSIVGYAIEFKKQIIKISTNAVWEKAKLEWIDTGIMFKIDEPDNTYVINYYRKKYPDIEFKPCSCICGHIIMEHCVIKNKITNKKIAIGNCCIRKFDTKYHIDISKKYNKISNILRQLKNNILKKHTIYIPQQFVLDFLLKNDCIDENEYNFLLKSKLNIKKHKNNIKIPQDETQFSYDDFIKTVDILLKIIKQYYHKKISQNEFDSIMFDIIVLTMVQEYKEKYYDEHIEKSPTDNDNIYQLTYNINDNKYEWDLLKKRMKCVECKIKKMIKLNNLINNEKLCKFSENDNDIECVSINDFTLYENKEYCLRCFIDKTLTHKNYKYTYGIKRNDNGVNELYYMVVKKITTCEICKTNFFNKIDEEINICDICMENGIPCEKCVSDKLIYDKHKLKMHVNKKQILFICGSCDCAKKYIKDFDKRKNYICNTCNGWNFLYYPCKDKELIKCCPKCRNNTNQTELINNGFNRKNIMKNNYNALFKKSFDEDVCLSWVAESFAVLPLATRSQVTRFGNTDAIVTKNICPNNKLDDNRIEHKIIKDEKQQLIDDILYKISLNKFDIDVTNINNLNIPKLNELVVMIDKKIINDLRYR